MRSHPVLDQLASSGVRLGLDNVGSFLTFLGEPHQAYPVVHVAGTNGKGSTSALLTWALKEAGYRVGTTMSPHLEQVNERVQVDGFPIDDASLTEAIEHVDRARWDWARSTRFEGVPLTYFEFLTAVAFHHFADLGVDVAVVEVGLGGRLDATNVVEPQVCAITSIGVDHAAELGNNVADIAKEKGGIIKKGVPAVIGPMPQGAQAVMARRARALGAPLWKPGSDLLREHRDGSWSFKTPAGTLSDVTLGLRGEHQGSNALVALGVLHRLREQGFHLPDDAIRRGFAGVQLPGRLEEVRPHLFVDGAHNRDGAEALAGWLARRERPETRILLFGMGEGRDPVSVIEPLIPHVDEVVTTRCSHPRARDSYELALALQEQEFDILLADGGPIEECLPEVYREAHETLVTGSLFIAGAARSVASAGRLDGITPGQGPREPTGEE